MMLENIGLLRGIMAKMNWLDQNQQLLAQNIANADTPGYRPETLKKQDFSSILGASGDVGGSGVASVKLASTDPMHFGAAGQKYNGGTAQQQKVTYESSPDNNGVVLEEQLYKANRNAMDYQLATDLYRRSAGMLRMAIQGSGR